MPHDYGFPRLARADFPLLRRWLAGAHLRPWWGRPDTEIALMEAELDQGHADLRLVTHGDVPFAYVQDFPAHHWPSPQFEAEPDGARVIDTFVGEPAFLGLGHAPRYLEARARALLASGAVSVLADPDPGNHRALRAFRGAGFRDIGTRPCEDGSPVTVLRLVPPS